MLAKKPSRAVLNGARQKPRGVLSIEARGDKVPVVPARHKADLLALGLIGGHKAQIPGPLADLGLAEIPNGESDLGELPWDKAIKKIALVFLVVPGAQKAFAFNARVMACSEALSLPGLGKPQ
jgi:hypothetical protein